VTPFAEEVSHVKYPMTLMEREDPDHRVELVYHGPDAAQQVTIHVYWHTGEFQDFSFAVHGESVLDAFNHPHFYRELALVA
jgi:hypothetical protein